MQESDRVRDRYFVFGEFSFLYLQRKLSNLRLHLHLRLFLLFVFVQKNFLKKWEWEFEVKAVMLPYVIFLKGILVFEFSMNFELLK